MKVPLQELAHNWEEGKGSVASRYRLWSEVLEMGTTNDFFQDFENLAALMEMINNLIKEGAMLSTTPLSIGH